MRGKFLTVLVVSGVIGVGILGSNLQSEEPTADVKSTAATGFVLPSEAEPFLDSSSLLKAAVSLDDVSLAWIKTHKCGSCHTSWPYLMSRALIGDGTSPALIEIRKFFENRITNWDADQLVEKHWPREIVGTSTALAMNDAHTLGKLHPITRQSLDRMWTIQREDGAWDWPKCNWPPFEVDDYYGAVLAAVGVGHAPDDYAKGDSAKAGLERLRAFFKKNQPQSLHHKTWLIWASMKLEGLISDEDRKSTINELFAKQRTDGGWSLDSLGKDWVGQKGETTMPDAPSDGYATSLVVFVLRQAQIPADHESIQRGKVWLTHNQRISGRWFSRSLNGIKEHYISDAATAFAVLALDACK